MTVLELKEFLGTFPDDMEIVNVRYSDYEVINKSDWSIIKGSHKDYWVMRSHPTMSDENKKLEKDYLCLEGN